MHPIFSAHSRLALGLATAFAFATGAAHAVSPNATIDAAYQKERAACLDGSTGQDRATCLREAAAARTEARRGALPSSGAQAMSDNARQRCAVHTEESARSACLRMAAGEGSTTGTAAKGGVLKSLTTVTPAPAAASK